MFIQQVTVEELFKDATYQPVLLRSCSRTPATSPNEESRFLPTSVLPGGGKEGISDVKA